MSKLIDPKTCSVALLYGGKSKEREVSLVSGKATKQGLEQAGFKVTAIDPANSHELVQLIEGDFDVAYVCLHGRFGEDGTVQGFLELLGLPYTGSGVWSSATAMDKTKSKLFYERAGLHVPQSVTLSPDHTSTLQEIVDKVGLPCVVKPPKEGSSVGIHMINTSEELQQALDSVFETGDDALVETYVAGMELTVAVLGNKDPLALPVIEIIPKNHFYDFESKYAEGGSEHVCPAPLEEEQAKTVQEMAKKAHQALECRGLSRSDFLLDDKGDFWILETNTLPGMTETSLLPDAARVHGMDFPELCKFIVQLALEDA